MFLYRFLFIFLGIITFCNSSFSITNATLDSLKLELENSKSDTFTLNVLNQLALKNNELQNTENAFLYVDRALILANEINHREKLQNTHYIAGIIYYRNYIYNKSLSHLFISLRIAEELELPEKEARSLFLIGNNYKDIGKYEKALYFYNKTLNVDKKLNAEYEIAATYNNIGLVYWKQSSFEEALEYFQKSMEIKEKINDKNGLAGAYTNLGIIYYSLNNNQKALETWEKSLALWEELKDKKGAVEVLNNIGALYSEMGEFEKAIIYLKKSLKLKKEIGEKSGIAMTSGNIGEVYLQLKKYNVALSYLIEAHKLVNEIGDNDGIISANFSLSNYYYEINNTDSALYFCNLALELANKTDNLKYKKDAYELLSAIYENNKDYKSSLEYYKEFFAYADSIYNKNNSDKLADLQAKYESEKKEKEIEILNQNQVLNQAELKRRELFNYIFIISLIFIIIISLIIYNRYRLKKKSNDDLTYRNLIIEQQKEELISQKELLSHVNDELSYKNSLITDSIKYAKKIQEAILPSTDCMISNFKENFIVYLPKDIVSGDFYWYANKKSKSFFAVVDCTGHGVPGAFMSMIGNTLLNDIINENEAFTPAEILETLNDRVIDSLNKYSTNDTLQSDGMDLTLFSFDKQSKQIQLSSVNQFAFIVKDGEIQTIEGDITPIGGGVGHKRNSSFKNHSLDSSGLHLYISTDGYYDQFGGSENKKFMISKYRNLILENYLKPMDEQKSIFEEKIKNWKGKNKQTDDILIAGFKF